MGATIICRDAEKSAKALKIMHDFKQICKIINAETGKNKIILSLISREINKKYGPFSGCGLDIDISVMPFNDCITGSESQSA